MVIWLGMQKNNFFFKKKKKYECKKTLKNLCSDLFNPPKFDLTSWMIFSMSYLWIRVTFYIFIEDSFILIILNYIFRYEFLWVQISLYISRYIPDVHLFLKKKKKEVLQFQGQENLWTLVLSGISDLPSIITFCDIWP